MPFVDFKKVKEAVTILQVLERYGFTETLKRRGDSLRGPCPVHKGGNPTAFRVSISKNCWNCFGACQGGGNILDLVSRMEEVGIRDAALLVQEWFGLETAPTAPEKPLPPKELPPKREEREEPTANKPLGFSLTLDLDHPYLAERGLTAEAIRTFGLGYADKGIMAGRIAIPIHNPRGELVAYAGRWPGEPPEGEGKYKLPPRFRKSLEVYNLNRALAEDPEAPLVVVEGFFDCIAVWQAGFRRVVALMGSSLSSPQAELLLSAVGRNGRITLFLDADEAGRKGSRRAIPQLATTAYVRLVRSPDEAGPQPDDLNLDTLRRLL